LCSESKSHADRARQQSARVGASVRNQVDVFVGFDPDREPIQSNLHLSGTPDTIAGRPARRPQNRYNVRHPNVCHLLLCWAVGFTSDSTPAAHMPPDRVLNFHIGHLRGFCTFPRRLRPIRQDAEVR